MALKDIGVYVDVSEGGKARTAIAVAMAKAHEAHLTGFYVLPRLDYPLPPEVQVAAELLEAHMKMFKGRASEAKRRFERAVEAAGIDWEWRTAEGALVDMIKVGARYADLLVAGQGEDRELGWLSEAVTDHVVIELGRPVLVVPESGNLGTVGKRIMVAWNESRESARAVHDALPLLERADTVTVARIDPGKAGRVDGPASADAIRRHLDHHGVSAEVFEMHRGGQSVGATLLARAADLKADLIVAGAYGHSRVRELALGGVTEHLFRHTTIPVLMSR